MKQKRQEKNVFFFANKVVGSLFQASFESLPCFEMLKIMKKLIFKHVSQPSENTDLRLDNL